MGNHVTAVPIDDNDLHNRRQILLILCKQKYQNSFPEYSLHQVLEEYVKYNQKTHYWEIKLKYLMILNFCDHDITDKQFCVRQ